MLDVYWRNHYTKKFVTEGAFIPKHFIVWLPKLICLVTEMWLDRAGGQEMEGPLHKEVCQ